VDFLVDNLSNQGVGSLRWAINEANRIEGYDSITFDRSLAGSIIFLSNELGKITDAVEIIGLTNQQGRPDIEINFGQNNGLVISGCVADNSKVANIALTNSGSDGILIDAADGITIQNSFLGLSLDGVTGVGHSGNGLSITNNSSGNQIGGIDKITGLNTFQRQTNLIGNNNLNGIFVEESFDNEIIGNSIGAAENVNQELGNKMNGILLANQANNNYIESNLISGNNCNGIEVIQQSEQNLVTGNFIGVNQEGRHHIMNGMNGIKVDNSDRNRIVGMNFNADDLSGFNVISGNGKHGIHVHNCDDILINSNIIGLGIAENHLISNSGDGVHVSGNSNNINLGIDQKSQNIISGNTGYAIYLGEPVKNTIIQSGVIGLGLNQDRVVPNMLGGIYTVNPVANPDISTEVDIQSNADSNRPYSDSFVAGMNTGLSRMAPPIEPIFLIEIMDVIERDSKLKVIDYKQSDSPYVDVLKSVISKNAAALIGADLYKLAEESNNIEMMNMVHYILGVALNWEIAAASNDRLLQPYGGPGDSNPIKLWREGIPNEANLVDLHLSKFPDFGAYVAGFADLFLGLITIALSKIPNQGSDDAYRWGQVQQGYVESSVTEQNSGVFLTSDMNPDNLLKYTGFGDDFKLHTIPQFIWIDFTLDFLSINPANPSHFDQIVIERGKDYANNFFNSVQANEQTIAGNTREVLLLALSRLPNKSKIDFQELSSYLHNSPSRNGQATLAELAKLADLGINELLKDEPFLDMPLQPINDKNVLEFLAIQATKSYIHDFTKESGVSGRTNDLIRLLYDEAKIKRFVNVSKK
jgi:hypothetical protein